jgi:hypothetical protein
MEPTRGNQSREQRCGKGPAQNLCCGFERAVLFYPRPGPAPEQRKDREFVSSPNRFRQAVLDLQGCCGSFHEQEHLASKRKGQAPSRSRLYPLTFGRSKQ